MVRLDQLGKRMAQIISHRPLTWRFLVSLDGMGVGEFVECGGLTVDREFETITEGGRNDTVHYLPKGVKFSNITLKRGLISLAMWDWLFKNVAAGTVKPDLKNITIEMANESGQVMYRWHVRRAYPIKWTGPDLKVESDELAMESIELVHSGFEMETAS